MSDITKGGEAGKPAEPKPGSKPHVPTEAAEADSPGGYGGNSRAQTESGPLRDGEGLKSDD